MYIVYTSQRKWGMALLWNLCRLHPCQRSQGGLRIWHKMIWHKMTVIL